MIVELTSNVVWLQVIILEIMENMRESVHDYADICKSWAYPMCRDPEEAMNNNIDHPLRIHVFIFMTTDFLGVNFNCKSIKSNYEILNHGFFGAQTRITCRRLSRRILRRKGLCWLCCEDWSGWCCDVPDSGCRSGLGTIDSNFPSSFLSSGSNTSGVTIFSTCDCSLSFDMKWFVVLTSSIANERVFHTKQWVMSNSKCDVNFIS